MTTVFGRVMADEARAPARHEARFRVERAQAREQRVDEPDGRSVPRHFVDVDRAGDVAAPRQIDRVVPRRILQALGDRRHVAEFGDLDMRAEREALAVGGHAHRPVERTEMRVDRGAVGPQDHQLAGLIRADDEDNPRAGAAGPESSSCARCRALPARSAPAARFPRSPRIALLGRCGRVRMFRHS